MKRAVMLGLGLAVLSAGVAIGGQRDGTTTFEGRCQFSGILRQHPPLTNSPAQGEGSARAGGPCFGTFRTGEGRTYKLNGDRVRYVARARGTLSCGGGTAGGQGHLEYRGERLGFLFSEARAPGAGVIRLKGQSGGSASGVASASASEDPREIARRCSTTGLRRVRVAISIQTTPAISSRPSSTPRGRTIFGTEGDDHIRCGSGNDRVDGRGGDDVIDCGSGHDVVRGGSGDDRLIGGSGDDRLDGGPGGDVLLGDSGDDRLSGGPGRDRSEGGTGQDTTTGERP